MFLRKMEGRQIVAGLLVAALLVLAAVNVTGLIQGREAVKKAEARYLKLNVDFGGKGDDTQGGAPTLDLIAFTLVGVLPAKTLLYRQTACREKGLALLPTRRTSPGCKTGACPIPLGWRRAGT